MNTFSSMLIFVFISGELSCSIYLQSYSKAHLLLRMAENLVFASKKDFQKISQTDTDTPSSTDKECVFLCNFVQV